MAGRGEPGERLVEYRERRVRVLLALFALVALLSLAVVASLSLGAVGPLSPLRLLEGDPIAELRARRTAAGLLAGMALGAVGFSLQAILRNPLVDPYILGVSSGGFLGSLAYIALDLPLGPGGLLASGLAGALLALGLTYGISRAAGFGVVSIVLAGVVVGLLMGSLAALLIFAFEDRLGFAAALMFGSLAYVGPSALIVIGVGAVGSLAWVVLRREWLRQYMVGEDYALSRGVDVVRLRKEAFAAAALGAGAVASTLGPIGFVGLIAPHLARLLTGGETFSTLVLSLLAAPLLMVGGDVVARTVLSPLEVPVGVFTSLMGAPFFLYLLARRRAWRVG